MYERNDGRYPVASEVLVWYPGPGANERDRTTWSWQPGAVLGQCGPDEWHVCVEVRAFATLEDGTPAPAGIADEHLYYPAVWRGASELRSCSPARCRRDG